jgi:hypothetical protein
MNTIYADAVTALAEENDLDLVDAELYMITEELLTGTSCPACHLPMAVISIPGTTCSCEISPTIFGSAAGS